MRAARLLQLSPDSALELERALAHQHHPDKGGDREQWDAIQAAYEQYERSSS